MDDATLDVLKRLMENFVYDKPPHVATILTSTPPKKISPALLLKGHDFNSEHLPGGMPDYYASEFLSYGFQAGTTHQCLQIYEQASRLVGDPNPEQEELSLQMMCQDLIQKVARTSPGMAQGEVRGNPRFFSEMAQKVYATYAIVKGFDKFDSEDYELEPGELCANTTTATAIACLIQLGRFAPAFRIFSCLFDQTCKLHNLEFIENPGMHGLGVNLPSLVDRVSQTLTNVAPDRLVSQRLDDAFGLLISAKRVGCKNLDPKLLDALVRAGLDDLKQKYWPLRSINGSNFWTSEEMKAMATRRILTFAQIRAAFCLLGERANISTVCRAIEAALEVECPKDAWEIRVWGDKMGIFEENATIKTEENGRQVEQAYEQRSSPQSIAQALLDLYQRGLIDRNDFSSMLSELGVAQELLCSEAEIEGSRVSNLAV
ncbi:hypothetical protein B0J17DRAFT_702850 [Rhizoctonia solani]|nr:hypothetical protein B0J17DRAFT_702850 [Rhizoctonia solani]